MDHDRKRYLYPLFDGRFLEVHQNKITNALPYIQRRIEYYMPIETVSVDEVREVISYIRVNVNRPCSADEVNALVGQIKNLLNDALNHMQKYEHYMYDKGENT